MKSKNNPVLVPTSKLIELAKERGVNFGKGNPNERIRYLTKLGLVPNAKKKALYIDGKTSQVVGHLPVSVVEDLIKIQTLQTEGYTVQEIASLLSNKASQLNTDEEPVKPLLQNVITKTDLPKPKIIEHPTPPQTQVVDQRLPQDQTSSRTVLTNASNVSDKLTHSSSSKRQKLVFIGTLAVLISVALAIGANYRGSSSLVNNLIDRNQRKEINSASQKVLAESTGLDYLEVNTNLLVNGTINGVKNIAGVDDTQILTNKSLSGFDNSFSNIPTSALNSNTITINAGANIIGGGTVPLGGAVSVAVSSTPTFSLLNLTSTTNQINIGTNTSTRLNFDAPVNSQTLTVPDFGGNDTIVGLNATQTLANKTLNTTTLNSPTIVSPTINLSGDSTGDTYYRDASGNFVRLPIGTSGQVLAITGNIPTWQTVSGGGPAANPALSNLSGVAINTSLLPGTNNSIDLGDSTHEFRTAYLGTSLVLSNGNNITISAAAQSASHVVTFPNSSGTVCYQNDAACGFATTTGANVSLSNLSAVAINTSLLPGADNSIDLGNGTHQFRTGYIGTSLIFKTSGGNSTTLTANAPTGANTITLPNDTGTVCLTSGNCAGAGGGVTTSGGTTNRLAKFTGSQTIGDSNVTDNGTTVTLGTNTVVSGTLNTGAITAPTSSNTINGLVFDGSGTISGTLATITPSGAFTIGSTGQNLTLQGANTSLKANSGGITNTLTFATPNSSNKTITVPNASGTVAVSTTTPLSLDSLGNITVANATTASVGVASFNSTNFTVSSGAVNTIQNINSSATPAFASETLTGASSLTLGTASTNTGSIAFKNSTNSNTANIQSAAVTANVTYQLPDAAAGTYDFCTSSGNCLGGPSGGANTSLSNLSSVAINTSLLPGADNLISLGNGAHQFASAFIGTSIILGTSGTNKTTLNFTSPTAANTITFPNESGTVCTTGSVCSGYQAAGSYANTALSNLAAVAINTSLLPGSDNSIDFGNGTHQFRTGYIATSLIFGTSGSNSTAFNFTTPTAARTITLPDQSGTVCLSSGNCASGGNVSTSGGTSNKLAKFTGATSIGDSTITDTGSAITLGNNTAITGTLNTGAITAPTSSNTINGLVLDGSGTISGTLTTLTPSAAFTIGSTSQALTLQGSASTTLTSTDSGNTTALIFQTPTANVNYRLPTAAAGTYDLCSTTGNCASVGGGVTTSGGTTNTIPKFTGAQTIGDSSITDNGSTITLGNNTTASGNINISSGVLQTAGTTRLSNAGALSNITGYTQTSGTASITGTESITSTATAGDIFEVTDNSLSTSNTNLANLSFKNNNTGAGNTINGLTISESASASPSSGTNTSNLINLTAASGGTVNGINFGSNLTNYLTGSNFSVTSAGVISGVSQTLTGASSLTLGTDSTNNGAILFKNSTNSSTGTLQAANLTANITYNLPNLSTGTYDICTSSGNCLGGGAGGANVSLSNLSSVAINTSLLPGSGSIDLGSNASPFRDLTLSGTFKTADTSTSSTNSGTLTIRSGNASGATSNSGDLSIDTGSATGTGGAITIGSTNASSVTTGRTGAPLTLQGNASSTLTANDSGNTTALIFQTPTADVNYRFVTASAGTYDVCTTSGNCLGGSGGGANTALSNLASVAINTSLLPSTNNSIDLGNGTHQFRSAYIGMSIILGTSGSNNTTLSFTSPTTANTITFPNESGTVCTTGSVCSGYQAAGSYANTALSNLSSVAINTSLLPGADNSIDLGDGTHQFRTGYVGTSLIFGTSGSNKTTLAFTSPTASNTITLPNSSGTVAISGTSPVSVSAAGAISVADATTSSKGIASFNSTNFTVSSGAVNTIQNINSSATPAFAALNLTNNTNQLTLGTTNTGTVTMASLGASRTYTLPDETGTFCLQNSSNCGFQVAGNYLAKNSQDTSTASTTGFLYSFTNSNTGAAGALQLTNSGTSPALDLNHAAVSTNSELPLLASETFTQTITGSVTNDRFNQFLAPTITAATSQTVTNAATLYVDRPPIAAGSAAITNGSTILFGNAANQTINVLQSATDVVGRNLSITAGAGNAVAADTGKAGGNLNLTAGAASANGTGSAAGGNTVLSGGSGAGGGAAGQVQFFSSSNFINSSGALTLASGVTTGGNLSFSGSNPTISASTTNTTLSVAANGAGTLTLQNGATGNIQFFSGSNTLSSSGNLTLAGSISGTTGTFSAASSLTLGTGSTNTGAALFKNSSNNNTVTLQSGVTSSSYTLTLPTAQGGSNTFLQNDGSGNLSFVAASGAGFCTDCVFNDSAVTDSTNTIKPTADATSLSLWQTSNGTPTKNIFGIFDSAGSTSYATLASDATWTLNSAASKAFSIQQGASNFVAISTAGALSVNALGTNQNLTLASSGAGVVNISNGDLQTGSTTRLTNAGALSNITGFTQTSGTDSITSTTTSGSIFALTDSSLTSSGANLANLTFKNNNTGAGLSVNGLTVTEQAAATPSGGANTSNLINLTASANGTINGINFGSNLTNYFTGTNATLTAAGALTAVNATLTGTNSLTLGTGSSNTGSIILNNGTNGNTVTIQPGTTSPSSYTLTLPVDDGNNGQILTTNGSGVLSWSSAGTCPDCVLNDSAITSGTNTVVPTTDVPSLTLRQTSASTPSSSIFDVTNNGGTTHYLVVDNVGNIGIGGTPSYQVDIKKSTTSTSFGTIPGIRILNTSTATNSFADLTVSGNNGSLIGHFTADGLGTATMANSAAALEVYTESNHQLVLGTNNTGALWINTSQKVGINANNPQTNLEVGGALRLSTTTTDTFTTPASSSVGTKINIPIYDPGAFGQIVAMGIGSGGASSARVISLFDQRSSSHQPTLAVFSPDENQIGGISWEGSNTFMDLKSSVGLKLATGSSSTASLTISGTDQSIIHSSTITNGDAFASSDTNLASDGSNEAHFSFTNANTSAGTHVNGLRVTANNSATPASGTNTTNLFAVEGSGSICGTCATNGIDFVGGTFTNGINFDAGTFTNLLTSSVSSINSSGDILSGFTQLNGSSTASGAGTNSTTLVLTSGGGTSFDVGNYVRVDPTGSNTCSGTQTVCYAKITAKSTDTLTISPALTWDNGAAVDEFHVPEVGATDTASTLTNRYGRGYFLDGIVTGNGSTLYTDRSLTQTISSSTFNFLDSNTSTLNIGSTGTTVNIAGALSLNSSSALTLGVASSSTGSLVLNNSSNSNTVSIQAGATSSSYSLTLPTTAGSSNQVLTTDGSGVLSWSTPGACSDCVLNDSAVTDSTNTIAPTNDVTSLTLRQTSNGTPTKNIFAITNSGNTTTYASLASDATWTLNSAASKAFSIQQGGSNFLAISTAGATSITSLGTNQALALSSSGTGAINLTSAATTANASSITANSLTTGTGLALSSSGTITSGGFLANLTANSLTTGTGLGLSVNGLTTGTGAALSTTSTTLTSAKLLSLDHTATYVTSQSYSGNLLNINRSLTASGSGHTITLTGALASLTSNCAIASSGVCTDSSNVLSLTQSYASNSGAVLTLSNSGTGTGINISNGTGSSLTATSTATSGTAASFTSNSLSTGTGLLVTSSGTITGAGSLESITGNSLTTGTLLNLSATALTTGTGLNITLKGTSSSTVTTGTALNISAASAAAIGMKPGSSTGSLAFINFADINSSGTTGVANGLRIDTTMNTTGTNSGDDINGIQINMTGTACQSACDFIGQQIKWDWTTNSTTHGINIEPNSGVGGPSSGVTVNGIDFTGNNLANSFAGTINQININNNEFSGTGMSSGGVLTGVNIIGLNSQASGTTQYGIKIADLTAGASTEEAINIGSGWDNAINVNAGQLTIKPSGVIAVGLDNTATTNGLCHSGANVDAGTNTTRDVVACSGAPADVAEWYETTGAEQAGDVVAISSQNFTYQETQSDPFTGEILPNKITRTISKAEKATTGYQKNVLGVVSTSPYQVFGNDVKDQGTHPQPIALSGRVPVKVSVENGAIVAGDYLTASATKPGYAMRATEAGEAIGMALASTSNDGEVLVFVKPTWFDPNAAVYNQNGTPSGTQGSSQDATFNTITASIATFDTLNIGTIKLTADSSGNLKVNGNLLITGKVTISHDLALYGSITAPNGLAIKLGSGKSFKVNDSQNDQLTVDQNGATVDQLNIAQDAQNPTNNSTGTNTMNSGQKKLTIDTSKIKPVSHVIVTFGGDYSPATRYWVDGIVDGKSFDINLDQPVGQDVTVNWWIVN